MTSDRKDRTQKKSLSILAVADDEAKRYYDYYQPGCLDEFDLIISCGDLHRQYLEFLTTMARCPVLYVCGNHDDAFDQEPPEGCICIDGQMYLHEGVRIMGLGGSYRYRQGNHMYTERQMKWRIRKLGFALWKHKGVDILVTHAPVRGINDFDTLSHRGFESFRALMDRYHPAFLVHGHIHKNYGVRIPQVSHYRDTTIINAYEYCRFTFPGEDSR